MNLAQWWRRLAEPTRPPLPPSEVPGEHVTPLAQVPDREVSTVLGTVEALPPEADGRWLRFELLLDDGSARLRVIWLGRSAITGIGLGTRLSVRGRLGRDAYGMRTMYNPRYEVVDLS